MLKRFEDAWRDGDSILAIVKGSAVNNDGPGTSFGTPNEKAQEEVYRAALKRAKVNARDVSFIETHGTGTTVGRFNILRRITLLKVIALLLCSEFFYVKSVVQICQVIPLRCMLLLRLIP